MDTSLTAPLAVTTYEQHTRPSARSVAAPSSYRRVPNHSLPLSVHPSRSKGIRSPRRLVCRPLRRIAFGRWRAQGAQDRVARPALWVAEGRPPGRDAAQEDGQASSQRRRRRRASWSPLPWPDRPTRPPWTSPSRLGSLAAADPPWARPTPPGRSRIGFTVSAGISPRTTASSR